MKQLHVCSECNSKNIEGKAWVRLNDPMQIDMSPTESGDSNDFWCPDCSEHTGSDIVNYYEPKDEVTYKDKVCKVIEMLEDDGSNSIYLIDYEGREFQVFVTELT